MAWIVLVVFGSLGLGRHGYTSILPAMQDALHLTNKQTGELQSWNLFGYLLTVVFAGLLATRWGPRVIMAVALLVNAAGMALTGLVPSFAAACAGRFFSGVGGAGGNVPAMALVSSWFGVRRRGLAAGAAVGGSSLGLIVTGPMVPAILNRWGMDGWRVSWFVLAAMAVGVAVLAGCFVRNHPAELGLQPIGQTEATTPPAQPAASAFDWALVYRSGVLWRLALVYFAFGFSYIIYATFFIRHLTGEAGFTRSAAGGLWLKVGIASTISGFIWGGISDRWGRRTALLWVFGLQGLAFTLFGSSPAPWAVYPSAVLFAVTAWSVPALMAAISGDLFGAKLAPAALGLITIVFGVGQAVGPYLAGAIADAQKSFAPAFLFAGLVAWMGAVGSFFLRLSSPGR